MHRANQETAESLSRPWNSVPFLPSIFTHQRQHLQPAPWCAWSSPPSSSAAPRLFASPPPVAARAPARAAGLGCPVVREEAEKLAGRMPPVFEGDCLKSSTIQMDSVGHHQ